MRNGNAFLAGVLTAWAAHAADVPRFGLFEQSFAQSGSYANPYTSVTATATFTPRPAAHIRTRRGQGRRREDERDRTAWMNTGEPAGEAGMAGRLLHRGVIHENERQDR